MTRPHTVPDDQLIDRLGGPAVVAEHLGQNRVTVAMWKNRQAIPAEFHIRLWELALNGQVPWEPPGAAAVRRLLLLSQAAPGHARPPARGRAA